jgi:ribosomal protein S18 acetylase RimI-like enzyme
MIIERLMGFRLVEENLRQSFRALAKGRPRATIAELPGISIASLGVAFQMFNAAFLSEPVETLQELEARLGTARRHFASRGMPWAFWVCEDWLARGVRRKLSRSCSGAGLRLSSELPGMMADHLEAPARNLPEIEIRRVESSRTLDDFRTIGSASFHVPVTWFSEVFDRDMASRAEFECWVGYANALPVATAARVVSGDGVIGLYNVATAPELRQRGYGEAITRSAIAADLPTRQRGKLVLQSTSNGVRLYERMGFRAVTRILVYNSG